MIHKTVLSGLDLDRWVDLAFSLDGEKEAAAEQMEAEHERPYRALYEALEAGKISAFSFWQGANMRIVAHSTRPDVLIQASLFWDVDGDLEPVSHADINNFEDLREIIPQSEAEARWIPAA